MSRNCKIVTVTTICFGILLEPRVGPSGVWHEVGLPWPLSKGLSDRGAPRTPCGPCPAAGFYSSRSLRHAAANQRRVYAFPFSAEKGLPFLPAADYHTRVVKTQTTQKWIKKNVIAPPARFSLEITVGGILGFYTILGFMFTF